MKSLTSLTPNSPLERLRAEAENRKPYPFAADLAPALAFIDARRTGRAAEDLENPNWEEICAKAEAALKALTESTNGQ